MWNGAFDPNLARFAFTPFGRTGPLLSAKGVAAHKSSGDRFFWLVALSSFFGPLAVVAVANAAGWVFPTAVSLTLGALLPLGIIIYSYSSICWNIRRLHDLGKSGILIIVPILYIFLFLPSAMAGYFIGRAFSFLFFNDVEFAASMIGLVISSASYLFVVYRPHSERWRTSVVVAAGQPCSNRYGQAAP